ncbi:MAG: HEPN domain-containing protein [Bacillota bacterium]|uniref:HEPN domain-containing protein n=1 Tax=Desulforudis sp. DRI-14 TaxID=3459793 RepID=UPI003491409D
MNLLDQDEYRRWLAQAEYTLSSAERDMFAGDHAWACFKAQQAGEYALKALVRAAGMFAPGHSTLRIARILRDAGFTLPDDMEKWCRELDRHYIPPRYPDAYPSGSPFEYYDRETAERAVVCASRLVQFAKGVRADGKSS